jgi:hypothetical protein
VTTEDYAPFSLADEARRWISEHGAPVTISDEAALAYVRDRYEGGTLGFAADVYAYYGFDVLAATLRDTSRADRNEGSY